MTNPTVEQAWLQGLIGDWTYEFSTADSSDHPGATANGTEKVRPVGDVWIVAENEGVGSDGSVSHSITTIGFEPDKGRFSGSVVGTMAPVLFIYDGALSDDGTSLVLETEGPAMTEGRVTDKYRDVFRVIDDANRETIAEVLGEDGQWREFMSTRYKRAA
jgi:hypothetical protein